MQRPNRVQACQQVDSAWKAIEYGWDIEPRSYFEDQAPKMGFSSPLAMAIHYMWKREVKRGEKT